MTDRRIMLIGATGCGKSSLAVVLNRYAEHLSGKEKSTGVSPVPHRQDVWYGRYTLDVPGGYFENPWMYNHLISLAQNNASHVLFVVSRSQRSFAGAPGLADVFGCPVSGVITHSDVQPENEEFCQKQLRRYGVPEPFFNVSVKKGFGVSALIGHLLEAGTVKKD